MRFVFYVLLLLLLGCQTGSHYVIKGQLPDNSYNGEKIYLVPLENAVKVRVDSTIITDGSFKFEGTLKTPEIFIIRAKPVLRINLQELLVVKEPGETTVKIGSISSAGGSALNDSLQLWKEKKAVADFLYEDLKHQYKMANEVNQPAIKQKEDSLSVRIVNFHYNFVRRNRDNVVGKFVKKMMGSSFSPEQIKELSIQ